MAKNSKRSTPKAHSEVVVPEVVKPQDSTLTHDDYSLISNYVQYVIEHRMNELGYEKYNFWDSWIAGIVVGALLGIGVFAGGLYAGKHYLTFL